MQLATDPTGRDYLERRSRLAKRLSELPACRRISIIDDSQFDADVLASSLRKILGRDIQLDTVKTLNGLPRLWAGAHPDVVFLDDRLGHVSSATASIPFVRKLGYAGPLIVVSGLMTRQRRSELVQLGATETLHKDDYDTLAIIELLLKVLPGGNAPDPAPAA